MTEERKRELRQLLEEARKSLVIRYEYGGPVSYIPPDVYKEYLQERWTYYGVDFLSFAFSIQFVPDIADRRTKSNLLDFIREELPLFINKAPNPDLDCIQTANYLIQGDSSPGDRLYRWPGESLRLLMVMERLLEITLVRGIQEAVSFFDSCSRAEGTLIFLRDIAFLEGIKIETEIQLFNGVRLVPLPSGGISQKVKEYLPSISVKAFINHADSFFGRTLLVIDRPGLSVLCKPSEKLIQNGTRIDDLPFQVEVPEVKFPNHEAVGSFDKFFCQALSLVCNSAVEIVIVALLFQEENSFNRTHGPGNMFRHFNPLGNPPEAEEADIEKAKCLYERLVGLDSNSMEKLRVAIERWIMSKTDRTRVDQMIDLGIALEALYVTSKDDIGKKLRHRASWYLGENPADQQELETEFEAIYNYRSRAVHEGKLDKEVEIQGQRMPISEFIESVQDRCRDSILKILEDGEFPDWNNLRRNAKAKWASS